MKEHNFEQALEDAEALEHVAERLCDPRRLRRVAKVMAELEEVVMEELDDNVVMLPL